ATIFNDNIDVDEFDVSVAASGGSVENIGKTINGDFQISLGQNNLMNDALNGEGEFEGIDEVSNLGVISSLFPEVVQVVTLDSKNIDYIKDLKQKKVSGAGPIRANKEAAEVLLRTNVNK